MGTAEVKNGPVKGTHVHDRTASTNGRGSAAAKLLSDGRASGGTCSNRAVPNRYRKSSDTGLSQRWLGRSVDRWFAKVSFLVSRNQLANSARLTLAIHQAAIIANRG